MCTNCSKFQWSLAYSKMEPLPHIYFLFWSTKSNLDEKKYIQNELCKYDYVSLSLKKFHVCLIELFWNLLVDVKFFRKVFWNLTFPSGRKLGLKPFFVFISKTTYLPKIYLSQKIYVKSTISKRFGVFV